MDNKRPVLDLPNLIFFFVQSACKYLYIKKKEKKMIRIHPEITRFKFLLCFYIPCVYHKFINKNTPYIKGW